MKTLEPIAKEKLHEAFRSMRHPRDFRPFVPEKLAGPELNTTRLERTIETMSWPHIAEIDRVWRALWAQPFVGVAADGNVRHGLRSLEANGAPVRAMVEAANRLIAGCSPTTLAAMRFPMNSPHWRRWHNMPLRWERDGLSFEDIPENERLAFMDLVKATVSEAGYRQILELLEINRFSGELIGRPKYLNEWCYQIGLFGKPSLTEPWGWQVFGHHLALNAVVIGEHLTLSPTFAGAEPTTIDAGPTAGTTAFLASEAAGLSLVGGLSAELRAKAVTLPSIQLADVPEGRRHWADGLHLAGAFQDNRTIPNEGVCAREMSANDRLRLMSCVETFLTLLPTRVRAHRLAEIARFIDETWFSWMGGYDDWSPFYFRIQSPVLLIEYDNHIGVLLTNTEPARFHVHTITRIPHGGDYAWEFCNASAMTSVTEDR